MPQSGLFPRSFARNTGSHAEQTVHDALKTQLPAGWVAWHSLRIRGVGGDEGEGDFVIVDPAAGLLILEVKGGQIEEQDGLWYQNAAPLKEAPREQGHRFARKLVERLRLNGCTPPGSGVATFFPDTGFDRPPPNDDLTGLVLGKQDLPWLREALRAAMHRALTHQCVAKGPWIETLHLFWGETWKPHLRLGQRIRLDATDRIQLDDEQLFLLDSLEDNNSLLVDGGAGTGKTLLACEAALRLAREGKKVLLLCFTDALAKWLSTNACHENLKVSAVRRFAAEVLSDAGVEVGDQSAPDFWKDISWRAAAEALPQSAKRIDAVVIDEGQDFAPEDWLLVEEIGRGSRLWAFWDPAQAFWSERPIRADLFQARFKLKKTYRCPEAVRILAEAYLGKPPNDRCLREAMNSGIIKVVSCPNANALHRKLAMELDKLLSEGLAPSDIAILSLRGNAPKDAIVHLDKLGAHRLVRADDDSIDSNVVVETFLRFKGLERPVIIVTDLHLASGRNDIGRRMHIALTRATTAVRIIDDEESISADSVLARLVQK